MGSSAIYRTKNYLDKNEIDQLSSKNNYINSVFSKEKNSDDCLTIKELNTLTNGLISEKILKKIIHICGSKKDKLTLDDFCYFYALLNTSSFEAKINFLLDFIFIKKDKLLKENYIHKIQKYFYNSELLTDIFLDEKLINNSSNLTRDDVYFYIEKNYKKDLQQYPLYINNKNESFSPFKNNLNDSNDNNNNRNIEDNNTIIILNNTNSKENSNASINSVHIALVNNNKYENLWEEFNKIEKKNNGIFPISLFENMLREIRICDELIEIIGNYLRKKTKKSFFNFELFKEILLLLIPEESNYVKYKNKILKGIFSLISFPKNYIDNNNLFNIFKNEKNIEKQIDKSAIAKHIELNQFIEIYNFDNDIFEESLNNLKYLQYIFFKAEIEKHSLELECITILDDKNRESYILERLQYDTNFYLIDKSFWDKWKDLTSRKDEENYNDFKKLRINTKKFSDINGRILDGCIYNEDFIIISETINNLFLNWYGPPIGKEVIRYKIYINEENNYSNIHDTYNSPFKKEKKPTEKKFIGFEVKTKKFFELELFPIFIAFFNYSDLLKKFNNSINQVKSFLRNNLSKEETDNKFIPFSRKTKILEIRKKLNNNQDNNNIRFWFYYNDFEMVKISDTSTLEKLGIENKVLFIIEQKINNVWPSDNLKKDNHYNKREIDNEIYKVGLINIGNTCYMNSILQIFLNIDQIKDIFIHEDIEEEKKFLSFILNWEDKEIKSIVEKKGYLIMELINLLKEKWINEKDILNPRKFKEICGEYNPIFKSYDQQDAHDFYTFLIDKLHEETNIKANSTYNDIENSDSIDTNEIDLGNECWANNIRKNASYFYALFMGQLKSTLICNECNTQKIKFEPFSALEIPIPEGNTIIIEIILFRLPYSLRKFDFDKFNDDFDYTTSSNIPTKESINLKKKHKKNKKEKSEKNYYYTEEDNNTINQEKEKDKNEVINNPLNLNIPLKLKLEVSRKEKCSSIFDKLKCMSDLNIEKKYNFTEFIMISEGKYINEDLIIDETFSNLSLVFIYELLNIKGIINIYDYEIFEKLNILPLKNQEVNNLDIKNKNKKITISNNKNNKLKENALQNKNLNIPLFKFIVKKNDKQKKIEYDTYEILLPIIHRYKSELIKAIVPLNSYQYFYDFQDFIILSSTYSIKPINLYEMMWKKYMYFLNCPSNFDQKMWWKSKKKDKKYLPFLITIINKENASCSYCPWFRFCTGCILDPSESEYINISSNSVIVIEWDKDVYTQEISKNNISLIMNHSSFETPVDISKNNNNKKITLDDCLKLFTKSEELRDIQCEKCKKKTLFKKTLEIERLPKYLVLVLKRFKYILTNLIKINNIIKFPLEDLPLQNYVSQKNIDYKYNLFGVINHSGTLEGGHYNSIFNINDSWLLFDDNSVDEINGEIETNKVYMLIYKSMNDLEKKDKNLNFMGLMERAYKDYLKDTTFKHIFNYKFNEQNIIINEYLNNCAFYYGEPVTVEGKRGFIVDIKKEKKKKDSYDVNVKVKLKKGFFTGTVKIDKINKETFKNENSKINIDSLLNERKNNFKIKEGEVVCGSQLCFIY